MKTSPADKINRVVATLRGMSNVAIAARMSAADGTGPKVARANTSNIIKF